MLNPDYCSGGTQGIICTVGDQPRAKQVLLYLLCYFSGPRLIFFLGIEKLESFLKKHLFLEKTTKSTGDFFVCVCDSSLC